MKDRFQLPPYVAEVVATAQTEVTDWSIKFLDVPSLWRQTEGEGVVVAVLDTGVDEGHPDLQGAIVGTADFTRSIFGPRDRVGHGTWCVGMIGARANDVGVRGIAPKCSLLSAKVLGDNGSGNEASIIAGIEWAANRGAHIISMSLGGPSMSERVHDAIKAFVSQPHRFVICAAGNDGRDNSVNYPAVWKETIAVAAVDEQGRLTRFSSRGDEVDVAAPGANMLSTVPISAGGYAVMSGTSMATPVVAAISAIALAKHLKSGGHTGLETYGDLADHLARSATDAGPVGRDAGYGWGLINPGKFLDALDVATPGEPTPPEFICDAIDHMGRRWHAKRIEWELVS